MEHINIRVKMFNLKTLFLLFIFLSFTANALSAEKSQKIYYDGYKYTNLPAGKQVLKNKNNNPNNIKNVKVMPTQKKYAYAKYFSSIEEETKFRQKFTEIYDKEGKNYENAIKVLNKKIDDKLVKDIAMSVIFYTMLYNRNKKETPIDARLVLAIIECESNFNPKAVSKSGALGLGQLMPFTAASVGLKKSYFHPIYNIYGTVRVLRAYFNRWASLPYEKQYWFAIASYNAGPNAVAKYGGVPPYKETQNYVIKVTDVYRYLALYLKFISIEELENQSED